MSGLAARIRRLDWAGLTATLDEIGHATTPPVLTAAECRALAALWTTGNFRSRVDMARHRFGAGEYRYFATPLPRAVATLRTTLYRHLVPVANRWREALGLPEPFPPSLRGWLDRCAARGQVRPTPLLLRYTAGGFNCLHQDLYGVLAFPLQVTFLLSQPERDFRGGELLLVEQRPRMQSRGTAVALERGAAIVFPNRWRPVHGAHGVWRATIRHGVSPIHAGERLALGIILHDAE